MNDLSRPVENSTMAEAHEPATGPGETGADTGIQTVKAPDTTFQTEQPQSSQPATPPLTDISLKQPQARLATGRLVATGEYQFGVDPFSYTTADVVWVNQSWVFDWLIYVIHGMVGGEGLVVCKSLLLVGLAMMLLAMRRPSQGLWLPVILVALSMLALSTRAFLQPLVVSFFFLGLTLYWLTKSKTEDSSSRRLWLLPPLFALWVNMDAWFILGPITVFLFWLGTLIDGWTGRSTSVKPGLLGKVLLVGLAACLLNPYHFRAFTLPTELATMIVSVTDIFPSWMVAGGQTVQQIREVDPQFMNLLSPLSSQYFSVPGQGFNVAGLAYYLLFLAGLASFVLLLFRNPREVHFSQLLIWFFFALLSLVQSRLIPFFAVVGGVIALQNLQDFFAHMEKSGSRSQNPELPPHRQPCDGIGAWWTRSAGAGRVRLVGRLATALGFLGLLFLAWPGWLHGPFGDFQTPHRVAWGLHIDTSLYLTAYHLNELREQGKIRQGFAMHPDVACYCAWFAPEVKSFIDYRFALFPEVAQRYFTIRRSLWLEATKVPVPHPDFPEWRKLAIEYDIDFLVITNFDRLPESKQLLAVRLWLDKKNWPVLYEDGQTLVFGWANDAPRGFYLIEGPDSHNQQAFSQVPEDEQPSAFGNDFPPVDRGWWRRYLLGTDALPLACSKAYLDQFRHRIWSQRWQFYSLRAAQTIFASTPVALAVTGAGGVWLPASAGVVALQPLILSRLRAQDYGPPADLVMMIRHARLGVNVADHNPNAYLFLSDACKALWKLQEDYWSLGRGQGAPLRTQLRKIQTIAALKTALVLNPENPAVHEIMGEMYLHMHFLDVALEHYSLALRYASRLRPKAAQRGLREKFDANIKMLEANVRALADEVKNRRAAFDLRVPELDPLKKFEWALHRPYKPLDPRPKGPMFPWYNQQGVDMQGFGLANRGLGELLQAQVEQMSPAQQFQLRNHQIDLLLHLGRLQDVQDALPIQKKVLGPYYQQYRLLWAAAVGNYYVADHALDQLIKDLDLEKRVAGLASNYCQNLAPRLCGQDFLLRHLALLENHNAARAVLKKAAELYLLRGLLALEKGDVNKAAGFFQKTLDLVGNSVFFSDRPIAERYLELIRTTEAQRLREDNRMRKRK
jgi:hypothetical protein